MILNSLYIENFRIYRGPLEIFFAKGDKNITIIQGNNEVGKTTIMNAITWCLYGKEPYKDEGKESILNKDTLGKMSIGDEKTVLVRLNMTDNKGNDVRITRTLNFGKVSRERAIPEGDSKFEIIVNKDGNDSLVSNTGTYISTHLPEKIREYFLFDGEQLEQYFSSDNSKNIKSYVLKLSQLNLLSKVKSHTNALKRGYLDDLDKVQPNLSRLEKKKSSIEKNLENSRKELEDIKTNIPIWEQSILSLEESLKSYGENPEKLVLERKELEDELDTRDKELENYKNEYKSFLIDSFNDIFGFSLLNHVQKLTCDLEEKGYIPAKYKKEFLEYLLENNECICGADLSEGSDGYKKLEELCRKTDEITNIADEINQLRGQIKSVSNKFPNDFEGDLNNYIFTIKDKSNKRDGIDLKINDINEKLAGSKDDEILELNSQVQYYKGLIKNKSVKQGSLEKDIERFEKELSEVMDKIGKEEAKSEICNDLKKSIDFCDRVSKEITKIYNELEEDTHRKLERLTSEEFKKMHWKEVYDKVSIDKDYNVTITKINGGEKAPADLSAGGKLSLALSFTTALNSLSGFELPILIDTPMGRLDESIKENIGKYLHNYVIGKQVTFIVTGSEYSDGFRKGIEDFIGAEYLLEHDMDVDEFTRVKVIFNESEY